MSRTNRKKDPKGVCYSTNKPDLKRYNSRKGRSDWKREWGKFKKDDEHPIQTPHPKRFEDQDLWN